MQDMAVTDSIDEQNNRQSFELKLPLSMEPRNGNQIDNCRGKLDRSDAWMWREKKRNTEKDLCTTRFASDSFY